MVHSRLSPVALAAVLVPLIALPGDARGDTPTGDLPPIACDAGDRCQLTGRVVDQQTGAPIAGAFVSAGSASTTAFVSCHRSILPSKRQSNSLAA